MPTDCTHDHVPKEELKAMLEEWREDYGHGSDCPAYHAILTLVIMHTEHSLLRAYNMNTQRQKAAESLMTYFHMLMTDTMQQLFPEIQAVWEMSVAGPDERACDPEGLN